MNVFLRSLVFLATIVLCACGGPSPDQRATASTDANPGVLYFANWEGEIGAHTLADFKTTTGIRVQTEAVSDNVVLETKLLTGHSGSDVVVPAANFLPPLIAAGALRELDKGQLPNWQNLDPAILQALEQFDPGHRFAVPYVWGSYGIAYNYKAVRAALGRDPGTGYNLLLDPSDAQRIAACGIAWPDGGGFVMTNMALASLGRQLDRQRTDDLQAAQEVLARVRPFVRYIDSSRYDGDLASGDICAAPGPSGDLLRARDVGAQAIPPTDVRYFVPDGTALMWIDVLVIPVDAPNPQAAHRFLNYLLDPHVIADVTNSSKFANAVRAADALLDPSLKNDPNIVPPPEVIARLRLVPAETEEFVRERTRMWTRLTTGQ